MVVPKSRNNNLWLRFWRFCTEFVLSWCHPWCPVEVTLIFSWDVFGDAVVEGRDDFPKRLWLKHVENEWNIHKNMFNMFISYIHPRANKLYRMATPTGSTVNWQEESDILRVIESKPLHHVVIVGINLRFLHVSSVSQLPGHLENLLGKPSISGIPLRFWSGGNGILWFYPCCHLYII